MFRLFLPVAAMLSTCLVMCPFLGTPPPSVAPDGGVVGESDAGVVADAGSDAGLEADGGADAGPGRCVDPTDDGGWEVTTDPFVASSFTMADCNLRGVRFTPTTLCELRSHLIGLWGRCTPLDGGSFPATARLLELRADSWHAVEVTLDGGLTRRLDLDGSGVLEVVETPTAAGVWQVNVQTPAGAWQAWSPVFETGPARLRIIRYPAEAVDFVRLSVP